MAYKILFIFLEGNDDVDFFNFILRPLMKNHFNDFKTIMYSEGIKSNKLRLKKNLQSYLKSFKSMDFASFLLLGDIDFHKCIRDVKLKIQKLIHPMSLEDKKIVIVVPEIEGWYAAGINDKDLKKFGITNNSIMKKIRNKERIIKEQFNSLIPKKVLRKQFMIQILENYDLNLARKRNESLDYFIKRKIEVFLK